MHKDRETLEIKVRSLKFPIQGRSKMRNQTNQSWHQNSSIRIQQYAASKRNDSQVNRQSQQGDRIAISLITKLMSHQLLRSNNLYASNRMELAKSIDLNQQKNLTQQRLQTPKSFQRFFTQSYHNRVNKTLKWKSNKSVFSQNQYSSLAKKKLQAANTWKPQIAMPIHSRKTTNVVNYNANSPKKSLFNSFRSMARKNSNQQQSVLKRTQQQFKLLRKRIKYEQRKRYVVQKTLPQKPTKNITVQNNKKQVRNEGSYRPWSGVRQKSTPFIN